MTVDTNLIIGNSKENTGGEIIIAPEVIEVIIGIAASKVEGVYAMRGDITSNVNELFGKSTHSKGVYLKMTDAGLKIDLYCYLDYGISVPRVALEMQNTVMNQVLFMTDIELAEVNVHVVGVVPNKVTSPSLEELFEEEDE